MLDICQCSEATYDNGEGDGTSVNPEDFLVDVGNPTSAGKKVGGIQFDLPICMETMPVVFNL